MKLDDVPRALNHTPKEALDFFAAVVEASDDAIVTKDLNGIIRVGTRVPSGSLGIQRRK
jgi:hypothetical protein